MGTCKLQIDFVMLQSVFFELQFLVQCC